jgi:uncharacterized membrane protein
MNCLIHWPRRTLPLLLLLVAIADAIPAQAAYNYTSIDYPGATFTQVFGINNSGKLVGEAMIGATTITFEYDSKKRTFAVLPNVPGAPITGALGINDAGVITGSAGDGATDDRGFILDKGAFTFFANPGWAFTQGRAISNTGGLVSGYSFDGNATYIAFIYDVKRNTFTNLLPSSFTIAQGINGRGDVVGNVTLDANVAYPGAPADSYGFLRQRNGAILFFGVTGGQGVRGRGINGSGLIMGFFTDSNGTQKGFVARLGSGPAFQSLTVPDRDLLEVPGAAATRAEAIDDTGDVAGIWDDAAGNQHGFLATRLPGPK